MFLFFVLLLLTGHGPPAIYDTPHFDLHFYLISNRERTTCVLSPVDGEQCPSATAGCPPGGPPTLFVDCAGAAYLNEPLPEDMMPAGYAAVCANEPGKESQLDCFFSSHIYCF